MTSTTKAQVLDFDSSEFDSSDSSLEFGPTAVRQSIWHVGLTLAVAMMIGIVAGAADQHHQGHGVYQISTSN